VRASQEPFLFDSRWRLSRRSRPANRGAARAGAKAAPAPAARELPKSGADPVGPKHAPGGLSADGIDLPADCKDLPPDDAALLSSAEQFIGMFHAENQQAGPPGERLKQVRLEIESTGTYRHTRAELEFAARVAWRNSSRCIGRLYWRSLRLRDRRHVSSATEVAAECAAHLRAATNGGRVRPLITVFAPDTPAGSGPRVISSQLVRYAGHELGNGAIVGDPANANLTRIARDLGWQPGTQPGPFDILPLVVQAAGYPPSWHNLPADAVREVPLRHPELDWFSQLGLRWYAVPVISDMRLDAGGISYPAAPFNGWYMCTEIGSRDLGDVQRYNQLPVIASGMRLRTDTEGSLWKDKAMTELNLAVLHSFSESGVTITDHHTESARFLKHIELEERQGRRCPADWTWIVPPAASSATPVFHRYYEDFDQVPNFYRHPAA
jgi:nitric-oxide synthase